MIKNEIDILSEYYQHELSYLRSSGSYFASRFPKIARRLDLSNNESSDPHVERLIESFAFLSGRLQKQIDDQFPEIATALMQVLYKPLVLPIPSCVMVNFDIDFTRASMAPGSIVPKNTQLSTTSTSGEICYFRTSHDLELWPAKITSAEVVHREHIPGYYARSTYYLKIGLEYIGTAGMNIPERLRFYINADALLRGKIFAAIFASKDKVIFQKNDTFKFLQEISPIGIDDSESLLPYPSSAFQGFRLLQEYFTFPEKFFGFNVDISSITETEINGNGFLYIPMEHDFSMKISTKNFSLSSVPAVNLFPKVSEPLRLDNRQVEYCLNPDYRRYHSNEIYTIEKMIAVDEQNNDEILIPEFFSCEHQLIDNGVFWKSRRKKTYIPEAMGEDVYVSFVDMNFNPKFPSDRVYYAHTLCTNRYVAEQVPVNGKLQIELSIPAKTIYCADRPTPQRPSLKNGEILWKLISALSLNSMSFDVDGIKKMREVLNLFADVSNASLNREIDAIASIESEIKTKRINRQSWCGFVRGTSVDITFDETLSNLGLPLSLVISKFLASYTTINTFTEVNVRNLARSGVLKTWDHNFGNKFYL